MLALIYRVGAALDPSDFDILLPPTFRFEDDLEPRFNQDPRPSQCSINPQSTMDNSHAK